jgi:hypothetical protein
MTLIFEQIVDTVRALPFEQQEILRELMAKWRIEARRAEIARDARGSLEMFRAGQLKPQAAQIVIAELRQALSDEE